MSYFQTNHSLGFAAVLLICLVSSTFEVEGQRIPSWRNYPKFARRLNNRNSRGGGPRRQKSVPAAARKSVPAFRPSVPATPIANQGTASREGKTLRNTFPFNANNAAGANRHHLHHHNEGSSRTASSAQGLRPPSSKYGTKLYRTYICINNKKYLVCKNAE